jgi:oxygen-dependent protoporphyrinogen oxidase
MPLNPESCDVMIVGAGLSGLTLAWKLASAGKRVTVLEKSGIPGGVIRSERLDGFLFEHGPNSFITKPEMMSLLRELRIDGHMQIREVNTTNRYLWSSGRLHKVTDNPVQLLMGSFLSTGQKLSAIRNMMKALPPPKHDISVGEYFRKHTSNDFVELVLGPALNGIYATPADQLSFEAVMPGLFKQITANPKLSGALREMKQSRKAVVSETGTPGQAQKRCLANFDHGMQVLTDAILEVARAAGAQFLFNAEVSALSKAAAGVKVQLASGRSISAGHIVLACSAAQAARLLGETVPRAAELLSSIKGVPLTTVAVGFREEKTTEKRDGFGFLAAKNHGVRCLGAIWNDRMFPGRAPAGQRLVTVFYGGQGDDEAAAATDDLLSTWAASDLQQTMGVAKGSISFFQATRYASAIPWFQPGHMDTVRNAAALLPPGIHLLGNYMDGVSIPARVKSANALAETLVSLPLEKLRNDH